MGKFKQLQIREKNENGVYTQNSAKISPWGRDIVTPKPLLTIEEVSVLLNLKISRIRQLIFTKEIPFLKIGASIRFREEELLFWIQSKSKNFDGGINDVK